MAFCVKTSTSIKNYFTSKSPLTLCPFTLLVTVMVPMVRPETGIMLTVPAVADKDCWPTVAPVSALFTRTVAWGTVPVNCTLTTPFFNVAVTGTWRVSVLMMSFPSFPNSISFSSEGVVTGSAKTLAENAMMPAKAGL